MPEARCRKRYLGFQADRLSCIASLFVFDPPTHPYLVLWAAGGGLQLQLQRAAVERGAGTCKGHWQEPVGLSGAQAPFSLRN